VVAPVAFQKAIDRDASHPLALLEPERIGQLLPTGALFLAKRLFDPSWIGSFPLVGAEFQFEGERILFSNTAGTFEAER